MNKICTSGIAVIPAIAVVVHPHCDEKHPIQLTPTQDTSLGRSLCVLTKFAGNKHIAVLAPSSRAVKNYAERIAGHLCTEFLDFCGGCGNAGDACECFKDFVIRKFGLVVILVGSDDRKSSIELLTQHLVEAYGVRKSFFRIFTPGMTSVYVA